MKTQKYRLTYLNTPQLIEITWTSRENIMKMLELSEKQRKELKRENERLCERERICGTIDASEKLALIRALQEIRDTVGLLGDGVSPREIVTAVKSLANSKGPIRGKFAEMSIIDDGPPFDVHQ